jgi:hypothetical protein
MMTVLAKAKRQSGWWAALLSCLTLGSQAAVQTRELGIAERALENSQETIRVLVSLKTSCGG